MGCRLCVLHHGVDVVVIWFQRLKSSALRATMVLLWELILGDRVMVVMFAWTVSIGASPHSNSGFSLLAIFLTVLWGSLWL